MSNSISVSSKIPAIDQKYTEHKATKTENKVDKYGSTVAETENKVDKYGNQITEDIKNNDLTTDDFLKIMMEQLKLQDPTKPKDMDKMLDSQMQMTTLNMNQNMIEALKAIQKTFNQSALANATGVIGRWVENGSETELGEKKEYLVASIEMQDGEVMVVAHEKLYVKYNISIEEEEGDDKKFKFADYDKDGNIYNEKGEKTGQTIELESPGNPKLKDGKLIIKDKDGKEVEEHKYVLNGQSTDIIDTESTKFPFPNITKVS